MIYWLCGKDFSKQVFWGVFLLYRGAGTKDMDLPEYMSKYITEPDNIYDLAGNCFGILSEKVEKPARFISDYVSEGENGNPNLGELNDFSETVMWEVSDLRPSRYDDFQSHVMKMIKSLRLRPYADKDLNELSVIYFLLAGIDAGAKTWPSFKYVSGMGPLDRDNKTGYRVYFSSRDTLHSDYVENIGRDRQYTSDFSAQFESFRFVNTGTWKLGENVPRMIYLPYGRNDSRRRGKRLRAAVIPGMNEKNFEFVKTTGSSYPVDYSRTGQKRITNKIIKSVNKALDAQCDLIVLPEYITSPAVFGTIQKQIKKEYLKRGPGDMPLLILSGSSWTNDDNNVLKVLDEFGDEIGSYYKYSAYTKKKSGKYGYELYESLTDPGRRSDLFAIEGWGVLLPAICRDVIDGEHTEVMARVFLPFLLVISAWSRSVKSFEERQRELANKYFISSILANACGAVKKDAVKIGNAGIVHKKGTIAGILFQDICRDKCSGACEKCECAYIVEFDFTYDDITNTKISINKL